jgi:hypothetical protein
MGGGDLANQREPSRSSPRASSSGVGGGAAKRPITAKPKIISELAQTTLARMQAVVHLFEALGGGWMEHPDERTQFTSGQVKSQDERLAER